MFSKEEAKNLREAFWTGFGRITKPHLSAGGYRVNWMNYRTGVKGIKFHLWAEKRDCGFSIDIEHASLDIRELQWEQLTEVKTVLEAETGPLIWDSLYTRENGKIISRVYQQMGGVSVYNKNDWPKIMPFLKEGIMGVDRFWVDFKELFVPLQ